MNGFNLIFEIFIFPGFLFLFVSALAFEWIYRRVVALLEDRVGPPWYQPLVDFIKLLSKEDILPNGTNKTVATFLPLISFGCVLTAGIYVPIAGYEFDVFPGDLMMVVVLLSVPSLAYFLNGWATGGGYSLIGANRSLLQYFSYEVPFLIAMAGAAWTSGSFQISEIVHYQNRSLSLILIQPLGFLVGIIALLGKLKRNPFDIPKAKTEVVAGPLTEISGERLALWHLILQIQAVVGVFLLVNVFLGKSYPNPFVNVLFFIGKSILLHVMLALVSVNYARTTISQFANIGWKLLVPICLIQFILTLLMRLLL